MSNFICINGLFYDKYFYIDTPDYIADSIFYKHKIKIKFGDEYTKENEKYVIVTCKVRKKYKEVFEKAFEEVKNKMILLGHTDYEEWTQNFFNQLEEKKKELKN